MTMVYQASCMDGDEYAQQDFHTQEEAIIAIEKAGNGNVVAFVVRPNMPGCLPAMVHNATGMIAYKDGAWVSINIHGW